MNKNDTKFLNEIKILDFTNHYSGDLTSMFLSDFGASVTKFVIKNNTNFQSDLFWNRNKKIIKYTNIENLIESQIIDLISKSDILIYDFQLDSIEYKSILRKEKLTTRDSRAVERKKPGRKKARKSFQFSKR